MPGAKCIVWALIAFQEAGDSAASSYRRELLATTGQHFVWVSLMAYVPHQGIAWRVVNVVQCHGEFDRAESGGEMSAAGGNTAEQFVAQLRGERRQFTDGERTQSGRIVDFHRLLLHSCFVPRRLAKLQRHNKSAGIGSTINQCSNSASAASIASKL